MGSGHGGSTGQTLDWGKMTGRDSAPHGKNSVAYPLKWYQAMSELKKGRLSHGDDDFVFNVNKDGQSIGGKDSRTNFKDGKKTVQPTLVKTLQKMHQKRLY